jgi:hypothetical protein
MRPFNRKSGLERLLEPVAGSLEALRGGLTRGRILKASLIAAGLTAGSAGISSLRRREEEARDDS